MKRSKKSTQDFPHKCIYCYEWSRSPIIRRSTDQEQSSHKTISRKCSITKKQIDTDSNSCKYFNPSLVFYCDKNQCFIDFIACLNRRRNSKDLDSFNGCKKCRQFENDIKPIIEDYFIRLKPIIVHKKIKRRELEKAVVHKRIIKRRGKTGVHKRIIKRRKAQHEN